MIDNPVAWVCLMMIVIAVVIVLIRKAEPKEKKEHSKINTYNSINWK